MLNIWSKTVTLGLILLSTTAWGALEAGKPTVLITGANRGIGLEFVRQFSAKDWNIIATAREPEEAADLQKLADADKNIVIVPLDVTDFARIDALSAQFKDQPIDVLLSNAALTPRYKSAFKTVSGMDFDTARQSFEINALAPLKLAQAFMEQVAVSEQKKIVAMSSKAGSFDVGPKMPMMYSYRGSKAALNMYFYTLSFETAKRGIIATLLSPGMVNTTPGFENKNAMSPEESVTQLMAVIEGLTPENNGQFLDYSDGYVIPW
jgi:NAD(P)-dependent dehydrogenase (short-subunit alcohol dehydrogenase family)